LVEDEWVLLRTNRGDLVVGLYDAIAPRHAALDGKYTIIGEVEFGQPMLDQIARDPREWNNRPHAPVIVEHAEIESMERRQRGRPARQNQ
jgi:cyclophilin family peptidyl-prolyl cis-trans isomerase